MHVCMQAHTPVHTEAKGHQVSFSITDDLIPFMQVSN